MQENAKWYAIQCKGGESFRAAENLKNQGFEIFHPIIKLRKKRQGRLQWSNEPLFPFYLFIRLDQTSSDWRPIRSTRGVAKLVSFGKNPAQVPDDLIAAILSTQSKDSDMPPNDLLKSGETVSIEAGPFQGQEAIFNHQLLKQKNGEKRAMILIEILNRTHQIEIPVAHIAPKTC
ncbi:MAG: transcription/translation regulatory transformer protein RfaH [Gammaproteobacteria bacterium]|nr:transcription/translation regulatory transformer protein RfaH [Gammaproteobacteria bacterium]